MDKKIIKRRREREDELVKDGKREGRIGMEE